MMRKTNLKKGSYDYNKKWSILLRRDDKRRDCCTVVVSFMPNVSEENYRRLGAGHLLQVVDALGGLAERQQAAAARFDLHQLGRTQVVAVERLHLHHEDVLAGQRVPTAEQERKVLPEPSRKSIRYNQRLYRSQSSFQADIGRIKQHLKEKPARWLPGPCSGRSGARCRRSWPPNPPPGSSQGKRFTSFNDLRSAGVRRKETPSLSSVLHQFTSQHGSP